MAGAAKESWDGSVIRAWLTSRIAAARADQAVAERGGRDRQDDCDKATAEDMVCTLLGGIKATESRDAFVDGLRSLLDRGDYVWRGIHDDVRFDRHVRTYIKKLVRMAKANDGFGNVAHYQ